jgi:hypothetical protein
MDEDRSSRERLEALLRLEATVRSEPERALDVLLAEVRALTGADCAMLAILEGHDGELHQAVLAAATGTDSRIHLTPGEHWPWAESGCAVLRAEGTTHVRDFHAGHPDHARASELGLRGFVSLPVASADGQRVVGSVCVLDADPLDLGEDVLGVLRLLTGIATGPLREQLARAEREAALGRSSATTKEVLAGIRRAQDELGNGLAVAVGRLRLAADPEAAGGVEHVSAALSRLERLSAAGAPALRELRTAALDAAAVQPVDLLRAMGASGSTSGHRAGKNAAWVLADPERLVAVLAAVRDQLEGSVVESSDQVLLPLADASGLTTEVLLDLEASGGLVTDSAGTPALAWPATTEVVPA